MAHSSKTAKTAQDRANDASTGERLTDHVCASTACRSDVARIKNKDLETVVFSMPKRVKRYFHKGCPR